MDNRKLTSKRSAAASFLHSISLVGTAPPVKSASVEKQPELHVNAAEPPQDKAGTSRNQQAQSEKNGLRRQLTHESVARSTASTRTNAVNFLSNISLTPMY
eukprot:Colp12_sorted_trinity150504_noHs@25891